MLCLEDCLEFCDLDAEEVAAIAEHEHIPAIVAAEMGCQLLKSPDGVAKIYRFFLDDIEIALEQGRLEHAGELAIAYRNFQSQHPLQFAHASSL